jgi:hypothetical protein
MREDGEELARKFRWDVAVPGEHWVADVGWQRQLTAASRTEAEL